MAVTPTYGGSTTYYQMDKPALTAPADIGVVNADMDIIDTALHNKVNVSDIQNNLTSTATNKPLSAAQGKQLNDNKVTGTVPALMQGSGFKLLTTAKTLPVGVHFYRLTSGSDASELPTGLGGTAVEYSYAIISVRSASDMICVMLFCGINESNEGVWINQSNSGNFWGWKKLATSAGLSEQSFYSTSSSRTARFVLKTSKSYIVTVDAYGQSAAETSGMYLVTSNTYGGHVRQIAASSRVSSVTYDPSTLTLSITVTANDVGVYVVAL